MTVKEQLTTDKYEVVSSNPENSEQVDDESRAELLSLIESNSEDIIGKKKLEKNLRKSFQELFRGMKTSDITEMLQSADMSQGDKEALIMLSEKYYNELSDVDRNTSYDVYSAQKEAFERELNQAQRDLDYLKMGINAQINYNLENLRATTDQTISNQEALLTPETPTVLNEPSITEGEMKVMEDILNGKDLLGEKLTSDERKLRREFYNAIKVLRKKGDFAISLREVLRVFYNEGIQLRHGNPDWNTLFKKSTKEIDAGRNTWDNSQIDTLNKGYDAFVAAHKGEASLYRWGLVIGSIERGVLSEGKNLETVYTENLNQPISKSERKAGVRTAREEFEALSPDKNAWMDQYLQEHQDEIAAKQQEWRDYGRTGPEVNAMTRDYLESRYNKRRKDHVKEMEKLGVQEADIGKFRKLVGDLESDQNKSWQDKLFALLTDTNFDGMRNHLDGQGTKRGLQVDQSLHTAMEHGKTPEEIMANIADYLEGSFGFKIPGDPKTLEDFYKWMSADILNAKKIQNALMNSPADALDIMTDGRKALGRTLEKRNGINQEMQEKIRAKLETMDGIKDLPEATRESIMASTASHLQSKIEQRGVNANENGLGVGVGVPLDQILNGLDFNLVAGSTLDGTPYVGVELAWNTNILSWKTGSINGGIKAGTNLGVIPVYGARLGFDQDLNLKQVLGDIDPHSLKTLNIGGNVTMIGALPSWGLSAGFSNDQLKGIEKQYNKLNKMIGKLVTNALKEIGEETDINKQKEIVNRFLSKEYKNADKESLAQATENIVAAIRQTLEAGIKPEEAANVISDWYAESWKNNAINGLSTSWKISGASVGVQFLAGFFPIATLGVTLTRYKNKAFVDDEASRQERRQKIENGIGNETAEFSEESFQKIHNQLKEAGVLINGEIFQLNADKTVSFSQSLINKPGLTVMIRKDLAGYLTAKEGVITLPAGLGYRFLKSMGATGTTMVLNIGGDKSDGMQPLNGSTLGEFVGEKDYLQDQYITGLRDKLSDLGELVDGYSINDEGHLMDAQGNDLGALDSSHGMEIIKGEEGAIIRITDRPGLIVREEHPVETDQLPQLGEYIDDEAIGRVIRVIRKKKRVVRKNSGRANAIAKDSYITQGPGGMETAKRDEKYGQRFFPSEDGKYYVSGDGEHWYRKEEPGKIYGKETLPKGVKVNWSEYGYISAPKGEIANSQEEYDYVPAFLSELGGFYKNSKEYNEAYIGAAKEVAKMLKGEPDCAKVLEGLETVTVDGKEVFKNPEVAYQIIDKLKAVFATIDDSRKDSKADIDHLVGDRDRRWKRNHKGLGVLESFSEGKIKLDYTKITDQLTDFSPKLKENLIGFTAFYRSGLQQEAKGLSLTSIGQTRVLGDTVPVPENQREAVIGWIKGNMERVANTPQGDLIIKMIGKIDGQYLGKDKLPALLRDGFVYVGEKIVRITLNPVMYLLAECGNESIGLEVGNVTIEQPPTGSYEEYKKGALSLNYEETTAQASVDRSDFSVAVAVGGGKKDGDGGEPENPDDPDNPDGNKRGDGSMESGTTGSDTGDTTTDTGNGGGNTGSEGGDTNDVIVGSGDDEGM